MSQFGFCSPDVTLSLPAPQLRWSKVLSCDDLKHPPRKKPHHPMRLLFKRDCVRRSILSLPHQQELLMVLITRGRLEPGDIHSRRQVTDVRIDDSSTDVGVALV